MVYQWKPDFSTESLLALKDRIQELNDEEKQAAIDEYFGYVQEERDWEAGDCWDNPEEGRESLNDFSALSAQDVFPGATDRHYDGIDQDCSGQETGFDADGDGFSSNLYPQADGSMGEDCNDENAEQYPNPDVAEIYYNGIDEKIVMRVPRMATLMEMVFEYRLFSNCRPDCR